MSAESAIAYFARHFVAIAVTYRFRSETGPARFAAASGTLIQVDDICAVLTAGHVIDELERILDHPDLAEFHCSVADTFGSSAVTDHPIPYDFSNAPRFHIDAGGLDFGLLFLHSFQVRLLQAHNMVPIDEVGLSGEPDDLDVFIILGLPSDFTDTHVSQDGGGAVRLMTVRVTKLGSDAPVFETEFPRFIGELSGEIPFSLTGMSGGPIFGFNRSRPNKYWIVAIQSSWKDRRFVFGCPTNQIAAIIRHLGTQVLKDRSDLEL
ncbi:MAG: hypothetical protein ACK4PN_10140 [Allorhizobium sp.]